MASRNKAPAPPPGYSYTREQDERPYRLRALHEEHPKANCPKLARRYHAQSGIRLTKAMVAGALRQAGVRLREEEQEELRERPGRILKLLATMRDPTRSKLTEAYEKKHGISLPYERVSIVLRQAGIRLLEPRRKPDPEEVEERPLRLCELAEEHPELTHDGLGIKYGERYGLRLSPSVVGLTLNRLDVYRHRLVDESEFAERPERIRSLAVSQPDLGVPALVEEYERLYDTKLHAASIQQVLNQLGIYRRALVDAAELAERPARLRALSKRYPAKELQKAAPRG